jgi:hypothetical protein
LRKDTSTVLDEEEEEDVWANSFEEIWLRKSKQVSLLQDFSEPLKH